MLTNILEPTHLIVILVVALLFLGPKRLPTAGRALGQSLKEFKSSMSGDQQDYASLEHGEATGQQDAGSVNASTPPTG